MNIQSRRIGGKYIEIKIQINELTHDLGFHSKDEAEKEAQEIRLSLEDLEYEIGLMTTNQ